MGPDLDAQLFFEEQKKTILIVEDSKPDEVLVAQRVRKKWDDVVILTSSSVAKAIQILKSQTVDMVLLDLNLDDSIGPNTVSGVRKNNPDVSIVVMTGLATEVTISESLKAGANHVCLKSHILQDDFFNVLEQYAV